MTSVMKPQLNLLFSLPDDLIRGVYDMDTTYRGTFSNALFKTELEKGYWTQLQSEIRRRIYAEMRINQDDDGNFRGNQFLNVDEEDGHLYFNGLSTPGMTPVEIASLPAVNSRIRDIENETYIYFSEYQGVLRFAIVPLSFKDKAHDYFKRAMSRMYDGVCTIELSVNFDELRFLRVNKNVNEINAQFIEINGSWMQYHDAITVNELKDFSSPVFKYVVATTSTRKFVLWM